MRRGTGLQGDSVSHRQPRPLIRTLPPDRCYRLAGTATDPLERRGTVLEVWGPRGTYIKYISNVFFLYFLSSRVPGLPSRCRCQQVLTQQPPIDCPEIAAGNKRISDTIDRVGPNNTLSLIILSTTREKECPIKSRSWNSRVRGFLCRPDHRLSERSGRGAIAPSRWARRDGRRQGASSRSVPAVARRQFVLFIPTSVVFFPTAGSGVPGRSSDRL